MNKYLNGTILETLERVKTLKTKIPIKGLPDCFYQLATKCTDDIDHVLNYLNEFIQNPKYQISSNQSRKLIDFQEAVKYIDHLENKIIAPLNRWSKDDIQATKFVQKLCDEINFPLLSPVVSRLSQDYYCIDTKFNHLRIPLLESEFLLHMPDLYHELAHSIIAMSNDPRVYGFQKSLTEFILFVENYCQQEIKNLKRNNCLEEARYLDIFNQSWVSWSIELFCDLYAVFALGPAYAWAHLYLCVKRGINPFHTPIYKPDSHPADNARMETILNGLKLIDFQDEAKIIKDYWDKYIILCQRNVNAEYKFAFPNHILEYCSILAFEGTKSIKTKIAKKNSNYEIYDLLNIAWEKFIEDSAEYIHWEREKREQIEI